jgi:hypothetical protein
MLMGEYLQLELPEIGLFEKFKYNYFNMDCKKMKYLKKLLQNLLSEEVRV